MKYVSQNIFYSPRQPLTSFQYNVNTSLATILMCNHIIPHDTVSLPPLAYTTRTRVSLADSSYFLQHTFVRTHVRLENVASDCFLICLHFRAIDTRQKYRKQCQADGDGDGGWAHRTCMAYQKIENARHMFQSFSIFIYCQHLFC